MPLRSARCDVFFAAVICLVMACGPAARVQDLPAGAEARAQPLGAFSATGGSMLTYVTVGRYAVEPTDEVWRSDVKGIVPWYHLDPDGVRARLHAMRAAGQTRVGFLLWFVEPAPGFDPATRSHFVVPQADFSLAPSDRENLLRLLNAIDAEGFEEVQVRFAQQGGATWRCYKNPGCYADPNLIDNPYLEEAIDFNWAFITGVIDAVEARGLRAHRAYDLAVEHTGHPYMASQPGWNRFTTELWTRARRHLAPRGLDVNLSFNHAERTGTEASFALFDAQGWPNAIALDVYDDLRGTLATLADALARHGRAGFPVYVQETFLNAPRVADELERGAKDFGLSLTHVMQWPVLDTPNRPLTDDLAPYDVYLSLGRRAPPAPQPPRGSIGAAPARCTLAPSTGTCSVTVSWSTTGVSDATVRVGGQLFARGPAGAQEAPWIQAQLTRFELWGDGAFIGAVDVQGVGATGPTVPVPPTPAGPTGRGLVSVSPAACALDPATGTCTTTVSWSVPGATTVEVRIGGVLFARQNPGQQEAPWITATPARFELWADGVLVDSVEAVGRR